MHRGLLDRYSAGDSPVHRLDPRTKIIITLIFITIVVSTRPDRLLAFVVYSGLLSWGIAWSQIPAGFVLLRAAAVLPLAVLAAAWAPFFGREPTFPFLGGILQLSQFGTWLFVGVMMKSFLGAGAAITLASTTPFHRLLLGLRQLGVPTILVDMLGMTYRYLFVLVDEAGRLRQAAAARGYRPKWIGQATLIGRLVGQLFLRSFERAERVYGAMLLRGYRGQIPESQHSHFQTIDWCVLLLIPVMLLVTRAYFH